jgi:hypothetical protein
VYIVLCQCRKNFDCSQCGLGDNEAYNENKIIDSAEMWKDIRHCLCNLSLVVESVATML